MSRHEVPKTAGKGCLLLTYDPARVSHLPVRQSVRHPGGVVRSLVMADPRVFGATPLDHVDRKLAPARGASLHDETIGYCPTPLA